MRPRRAPAIGLTATMLVAALLAPSAHADPSIAAGEAFRGPVATPRCVGGAAVTSLPGTSVRMVAGPCGEMLPTATATDPAATTVGMLPDCGIPTHDDRCEAWTAPRYDGPWAGDDWPGFGSIDRVDTVVSTPDGRLVLVGGTSTHGSGSTYDADFVEIAYDAQTGRPVWTSTWEGDGDRTLAYQSSIALSPDGATLFALGVAAALDYRYFTYVVAFDAATGHRLWQWQAPFGIHSIASGDVRLPDGGVASRLYLAGLRRVGEKLAGMVAAVDVSSGPAPQLIWQSANPDPKGIGSLFNDLAVSPDGSTVFATGGDFREDTLRRNFATAAYRSLDGERLWASRDELTQPDGFFGNNGATDLAVAPDGSRVYIAGFDPVTGNGALDPSHSALVTVARDAATGQVSWRGNYLGPVPEERHFYFSLFQRLLAVTPDGETVVATGGLGLDGSATVAYAAGTGDRRWGIESRDPVDHFSHVLGFYPTLAVGSRGDRVYVTNPRGAGWSTTSYVTTAYDLATGEQDWMARFTHNVSYPAGIVASSGGDRIFVTGITKSLDTVVSTSAYTRDSSDIQTLAYDA